MDEQSAIEEAGTWYGAVLGAVQTALLDTATIGRVDQAAAALVQSLARQGWVIERESVAGEAHTQ